MLYAHCLIKQYCK